ncbi:MULTISPECIES: efflux RND transporter permease subunit [Pseudoalteromonas]|uniref:Efflux pump membrane transporter n=3 Tax=Pseudoalteromonas ruthenica TaxID=151081 RepID=A0A0F4PVB8_9GAMM|nr:MULTISPECIES: efflux RND transporter permease subunit [Pseudoalteromonas]KJY98973.1 multidrug transporter [Pseudoalteromonas ruthenica]KJZ01369.1 multidrug transporter [Pseudoalteromonas ruthenica]MCF2861779.1 efflux RND transporter permease subunit [Pseudoalteromonas sp. CNAT2-18]MCG7557182.1 efflux RND transporter permease subunit [Pseudoalteromonas sp. CNAT2-18.1]MCG7568908.1 efflux RND transporter permease subunit [Pseudoalteromonas sp. CNC9-20]
MANFFIGRPIFAWVIAIVIMLAGLLSVKQLPVEQYPKVAPPAVSINASYPGATAQTAENAITQVIEQAMNGLDNLMYMSSQSDSVGNVSLTLTFETGTDPDIAQVQVQNKLQRAIPLLPQEVQQQGVSVAKSNGSFLMVIGFISEDGSMNREDIADYVVSNVKDPISRTPGVGNVTVFGSQYAMRIWLDAQKLNQYQLTPTDVTAAIKVQNNQVTAGQLGGAPALPGQQYNAAITAQSRLSSPEEFGQILLRVNEDGSRVQLKDVARVELGGEDYSVMARYNGMQATGIAIELATGANALDTAEAVRARLDELKPYFPEGLKIEVPYDTTPFVELSISSVVQTLFEAVLLVFVVMYLFLQNFRATLIPTLAIPVVLLGTFGIMSAMGFSINTLTMFGMVLAIGLLVDDAIVVVENVERVMSEEGLGPVEATRKSMGQITGALVGIGLVLSAVFVPMAFFGGATGAIYKQFSITIVSAMALSVLVAIIFTPALCATILKPIKGDHLEKGGFFGWFNRTFDRSNDGYQGAVGGLLKRPVRSMALYGAIIAVMALMFARLPSSFLPDEDQGIFLTMVQLPSGASQERTEEIMTKVADYYHGEDSVRSVFTVSGFSFAGRGQNVGLAFVRLKDWSERDDSQSVQATIGRAMGYFSTIKEAQIFAFNLPPIQELGQATGFNLFLQDRGALGHDALLQARNQLLGMAAQRPELMAVRPNGMEDAAQLQVDIDQLKAQALGVSISEINQALSIGWGSRYVNDFTDRGRVKKVYVQADAEYRMTPEDLSHWYVRNNEGEMVSFDTFATSRWVYGPQRLERYNGISAMEIQGQPAPGYSSGVAMQTMAELVAQLPPGIDFEWTGTSYQEKMSGSQAPMLYALSILVVFLCLAALYESWAIPFSVIMVVPLGIIGALSAAFLFGLQNDVYFQVGLLTTMGLASKNAILIVEFAKDLQQQGRSVINATLEAVRLRLRPIIMTSLAFSLGVLPLAISSGAGSASRNAIGIGVLGGMLSATFLAIFLVPVFYLVVQKLFVRK